MSINGKTKLCCIIGNPVKHSLSPQMHNAGYKHLGLNFVYVAFRVVDVKTAIYGLKALGTRGIVVTVPYKIEVMKYIDELDEAARAIGAVNTIVNDKGILKATNTDWVGGLKTLEKVASVKGKKVAVLGAGGAARALVYGLKNHGALITVHNRTIEKAQLLVNDFDLVQAFPIQNKSEIINADIIVNTTSVGMEPKQDESPIPIDFIDSHHIVFDIVYTPKKTRLLTLAESKSATIVYGDKMVLYGAVPQFELFTGVKAPFVAMEKALVDAERSS